MLKGCYFTARDGGRHGVVHWSGAASSVARKQVMFLQQKSGQQKRTPVVRGDTEPDVNESDIHPLSQAAYWYRRPGSVHGGSNKLHWRIDQRQVFFNMAWEWSITWTVYRTRGIPLFPSKCCSGK
jgi:hypothetical protein